MLRSTLPTGPKSENLRCDLSAELVDFLTLYKKICTDKSFSTLHTLYTTVYNKTKKDNLHWVNEAYRICLVSIPLSIDDIGKRLAILNNIFAFPVRLGKILTVSINTANQKEALVSETFDRFKVIKQIQRDYDFIGETIPDEIVGCISSVMLQLTVKPFSIDDHL